MTLRQLVLKKAYPLFRLFRKWSGHSSVLENTKAARPYISFYSLSANLNNNKVLSFDQLRGKKVLLVNTASDCGYTNQYAELQQLYVQMKDKLIVLGFPANDFKEQEKGNDEEIARFCQTNFGVTFPVAKKSVVLGEKQNPVFRWLTRKEENGWNEQSPKWNFSKYLVNEEGVLTHYFDPALSPLGIEMTTALGYTAGA